ncbi:tyrosine-type recombinase/integrase [Elizabethkingia anophelis]|uniref:tyrosine-type recombinase/integrase n=1 Tax=Elizabethkingia anophelis TaxID=1117645 RepID=UPI0038914EE6
MVCNVAESFDIDVHKHVSGWKFEVEKATKHVPKSIYLTFEELDKIEQTEMPHDYLVNAKDWLLIACYTGQRVSDYSRFTSSMIVEDSEGQKYIEFTQQKTNSKMQIPLLKKVQEILNKRDGEFPRKISDVKLNLYIKEVCEIAGIDEMIYNGKVMTIEKEDKTKITRKIFGQYPKHELVTSHIGRKSFASNFYEKIPTAYLLNFTGHTTEKQLLAYINKTEIEKAKSTAKIFNKLGY